LEHYWSGRWSSRIPNDAAAREDELAARRYSDIAKHFSEPFSSFSSPLGKGKKEEAESEKAAKNEEVTVADATNSAVQDSGDRERQLCGETKK